MKIKMAFMMSAMLLMMAGTVMTACSSDDGMNIVSEGQSPSGNSETDNDNSMKGTSDDLVDFQLQNEDGIECYEFNEGDNIIFKLEIKNESDEDAYVTRFYEMIGWDGFRVFSINGEDMGTPWDIIFTDSRMFDFIEAHSSVVILCPWFDTPALYWCGREHCYSNMYYKTEEKSPLPKGDYYSKFDIKLNDKTIICHRNFKIK